MLKKSTLRGIISNLAFLFSNRFSPFFPDEKRRKKIEAGDILPKIQLPARKQPKCSYNSRGLFHQLYHCPSIKFLNAKISNAEAEQGPFGIFSKKNYRQHVGFEFGLRA